MRARASRLLSLSMYTKLHVILFLMTKGPAGGRRTMHSNKFPVQRKMQLCLESMPICFLFLVENREKLAFYLLTYSVRFESSRGHNFYTEGRWYCAYRELAVGHRQYTPSPHDPFSTIKKANLNMGPLFRQLKSPTFRQTMEVIS